MRLQELIEMKVKSSWLKDLTYSGGNIIITVNTGHRYIIRSVPQEVYTQWLKAKSKGQFFHQKIKRAFDVNPL